LLQYSSVVPLSWPIFSSEDSAIANVQVIKHIIECNQLQNRKGLQLSLSFKLLIRVPGQNQACNKCKKLSPARTIGTYQVPPESGRGFRLFYKSLLQYCGHERSITNIFMVSVGQLSPAPKALRIQHVLHAL